MSYYSEAEWMSAMTRDPEAEFERRRPRPPCQHGTAEDWEDWENAVIALCAELGHGINLEIIRTKSGLGRIGCPRCGTTWEPVQQPKSPHSALGVKP